MDSAWTAGRRVTLDTKEKGDSGEMYAVWASKAVVDKFSKAVVDEFREKVEGVPW